jgi:glycerate-2-kinase
VIPPAGARVRLEAIYGRALAAVDAAAALRTAVVRDGDDLSIAGEPVGGSRLVVLAVGKAAAAMAAELERIAGDRIAVGLAVTVEGHGADLTRMSLLEAAHPLPDARGARAAEAALNLVASATGDDLLLVLLSGGASSLLTCPAPGLSLSDVADTTQALLSGGVEIEELNAVRKHLSRVAGGRLARRSGARRLEVLTISDVPGDRLDVIGSGPFAPDPTTYRDALAVVDRAGIRERVPGPVRSHLAAGVRGEVDETPKPGDPAFDGVRTTLLASNQTALDAARLAAQDGGLEARVLAGELRGEARDAGRRLVARARAIASDHPVCLVAGGETAVHVRGSGRGGRSQELALAAALELAGRDDVALLAAGTDGTDGPTDAAGAFADGGTVARGLARGIVASQALDDNDSYTFFAAEGGLFRTGPTLTNVMDLALVYVERS